MAQVIQIIGAVLVLGAFVANQQHRLDTDSVAFLALNAVGTGILAACAIVNGDIGFTLLEGAWSLVSLRGLVHALRKPEPDQASK